MKKRYLYASVALAGVVLGVIASGCLQSSVTCTQNLKACGQICSDVSSDPANCGACGIACGTSQVCTNSQCVCASNTTFCNGACVPLNNDAQNCGACGNACGQGQVCEAGQCKVSCTLGGTTVCGQSCIDTSSDPANCGACGHACAQGQACHAGSCAFDALATCISYNVGQVVGLNTAGERGQLTDVGTEPETLAIAPPVVLVGDANDGNLRQITLTDLSLLPPTNAIGGDPQGILVDNQSGNVFVTTSTDHNLTVFAKGVATNPLVTGYTLTPVGGYALPDNSFPHGAAKLGNTLYVPQYGCCISSFSPSCTDPTSGNIVAKLDVSNPASPTDAGVIDLGTLSLQSFDGGTTYARPATALVVDNKVYFALSNLDATCAVAGPGIVATYDTTDGGLSQVTLPTSDCLSPFGLANVGGKVVVSCAGLSDFTNFPTVTTQKSELVLLDQGQPVATYKSACPVGDASCQDPSFARLAAKGNTLFVAEQTQGRIYVLNASDAGFQELRGYASDAGPVFACLAPDGGSNGETVNDIETVP